MTNRRNRKKSKRKSTVKKLFLFGSEWFFILLFFITFWFSYVIVLDIPPMENPDILHQKRKEVSSTIRTFGNSWAKKSNDTDWIVYLEGTPFSRGYAYGQLIKESVQLQEDHFIDQIEKMVPSAGFRKFLMVMIAFFNRDLDEYIPQEFLSEIYGVSFSFSDSYDNLAGKFDRILNYHAAHDIGHALNDYAVVGCTSFSAKGEYTEDGSMLVGRNFDFYMGDNFAREKVLTIMKPSEGYGYVSYSWAGMMGAVSGMNEKGISVTINAAKSHLPTVSKMPISLLTREILQYAATTEEAIEIVKKRDVFVSETFMISSASEKKTILIEKAPQTMDVFETADELIICSNHYQSEAFKKDEFNQENIRESDSKFRYDRMQQLINEQFPLTPVKTAGILRNKEGLNDQFIGYGNPKSLNQFIAHHGIIFEPEKMRLWVSTSPYQMGEFICYDLATIFNTETLTHAAPITIDSLSIPEDTFIQTTDFEAFNQWKTIKQLLFEDYFLGKEYSLTPDKEQEFIRYNPESYVTYMTLAEFYKSKGDCKKAVDYLDIALTKEQASLKEQKSIEKLRNECIEHIFGN